VALKVPTVRSTQEFQPVLGRLVIQEVRLGLQSLADQLLQVFLEFPRFLPDLGLQLLQVYPTDPGCPVFH